MCSIRLATMPMPSQITKIPGGTGTRWLVSTMIRSPLESTGSIESPSMVMMRRSPERGPKLVPDHGIREVPDVLGLLETLQHRAGTG